MISLVNIHRYFRWFRCWRALFRCDYGLTFLTQSGDEPLQRSNSWRFFQGDSFHTLSEVPQKRYVNCHLSQHSDTDQFFTTLQLRVQGYCPRTSLCVSSLQNTATTQSKACTNANRWCTARAPEKVSHLKKRSTCIDELDWSDSSVLYSFFTTLCCRNEGFSSFIVALLIFDTQLLSSQISVLKNVY